MKADVHPAAPPGLEIPSWVPAAIAQSVAARYAEEVDRAYRAARRSESGYFAHDVPDEHVVRADAADLLRDVVAHWQPLVADRRMERVWRELSRRRALPPLRQDEAMLALFNLAFTCREQRGATTTQRQVEQQRDYYLGKAAALLDDATAMQRSWRDEWLERHEKLAAAAQAYQAYAAEVYAISSPMALERKHDGRARWVVLSISSAFHTLFGHRMYGSTATIASVILGREIDTRTVRFWCHPAVRPPTISS
jgi:hypothetical protein